MVGSTPSARGIGLGTFALAIVCRGRRPATRRHRRHQEGLPASFSPSLLQKVPAGAFLAGTFKGGGELTEQFRKALAGNGALLREFERELGITFEDVFSLFEGETVFYVRPGVPIPEITLVLEQTERNWRTIDKLFERLARAVEDAPSRRRRGRCHGHNG